MPHTYSRLAFHVVFATAERRPWLRGEWVHRLWAYIGGLVRNAGGVLLGANGPGDHVHLLMALKPTICLADLMRALKSDTSTWMHANIKGMRLFRWQEGYSAFTVSGSAEESIRQYIAGQEEHHRGLTFEEELRRILVENGVEYDPRYFLR